MESLDMRFDRELLKNWCGKKLAAYKADPMLYTSTVTGVIGLFVGDEVYALRNRLQEVDYFGAPDEAAVFTLQKAKEKEIRSFYPGVKQEEVRMDQTIQKVILVNENQRLYENKVQTDDVWLTRALILVLEDTELCFMKDTVTFSEEILFRKGTGLKGKVALNTAFLEDWEDGLEPVSEYIFEELSA